MQGKEVPIPYPTLDACVGEGQEITEDEKTWSRSGKKEGRSFHHGRFIDALRRKVIKDAPGVQVLEGTVSNLVTCDHTTKVIGVSVNQKVKVQQKGDEAQGVEEEVETVSRNYYAPLTIIADGCFSKFRKAATQSVSPKTPSSSTTITKSKPSTKSQISPPTAETKTKSHFIGLVIKDVQLPKAHHGTVCLTPAGPVLLYQIADEARETRLLVDVKGKLPSISDGSMKVSESGWDSGSGSQGVGRGAGGRFSQLDVKHELIGVVIFLADVHRGKLPPPPPTLDPRSDPTSPIDRPTPQNAQQLPPPQDAGET
jgi:squalene monooxygenase